MLLQDRVQAQVVGTRALLLPCLPVAAELEPSLLPGLPCFIDQQTSREHHGMPGVASERALGMLWGVEVI